MYSDLAVASKTDATIFCDIADVLTPTNRISNDEYNHLGYFWDETYTGIKSANTIISYVDKVEGLSEQTKTNIWDVRTFIVHSVIYNWYSCLRMCHL